MKKKVFVMLSGGVDSSVAAARLIDAGFDVTGIFMKNWSYDRLSSQVADLLAQSCPTEEDAKSAKAAAEYLGISFKVVNFEQEYWDNIVEPFFKQYAEGLTPNPDVWCNKFVKFGVFLDWALQNGADLVATGHYARLKKSKDGKSVELWRGVDPAKDQSYFLSQVAPDKLKHVLFPIGHLYKSQVRMEAATRGLPTASRKDSQGICFIGQIPIKEFLKERLPEKRGEVVLGNGDLIGYHSGAWFYTIGQRHFDYEMTKAVNPGNDPEPLYIIEKDVQKNRLVVGPESKQSRLWQNQLVLRDTFWHGQQPNPTEVVDIEIRYHQFPRPTGKIIPTKDGLSVAFSQPVRAVTPGQTVVFSMGQKIIGAGIIQ
jgi:tRNA-specific 2-thiouridylase